MNSSQAKCIPIPEYLAREGFQPARTRQGGRELWYHSPVRDGDEHPSFKVWVGARFSETDLSAISG